MGIGYPLGIALQIMYMRVAGIDLSLPQNSIVEQESQAGAAIDSSISVDNRAAALRRTEGDI